MVNKLTFFKVNLFLILTCNQLISSNQPAQPELLSQIISGYLYKLSCLARQERDEKISLEDHIDKLRRIELLSKKIQTAYAQRKIDGLLVLLPRDLHEPAKNAKPDFDTPVLDTRNHS